MAFNVLGHGRGKSPAEQEGAASPFALGYASVFSELLRKGTHPWSVNLPMRWHMGACA